MIRLNLTNVAQLLYESFRQGILPKNFFRPAKR
jgi:hypothetical protein